MCIYSRGVGTRGARGARAPLLKKVGGLSPPATAEANCSEDIEILAS